MKFMNKKLFALSIIILFIGIIGSVILLSYYGTEEANIYVAAASLVLMLISASVYLFSKLIPKRFRLIKCILMIYGIIGFSICIVMFVLTLTKDFAFVGGGYLLT